MALDDVDIDRIGDKIELKMRQVMDEHKENDHAPLLRKLSKMDGKLKWFAGAAAGISAATTHGLHKMFGGN